MDARTLRNRRKLADLFAGPFPSHAIIMDPEPRENPMQMHGDFTRPELPLDAWLPLLMERYEERLRYHEALDDDSVPYFMLSTGTEIFAAAFGCGVHLYEDSPPSALARVTTAAEADALAVPSLDAPPLDRYFEMARRVRARVGPEVPLSVPDIQSAFDIAALIWRKEDMYIACKREPDAVKRLVAKCQQLLIAFFDRFLAECGEVNLCHCPIAWAPPELGVWLSEDEAGALSVRMFEEFCLPTLVELSERYGGLFVHCCATADHQYASFKKIPDLRGLNRVFQKPGPGPAIEAFAGQTVLMVAWTDEEGVNRMLDMARPGSRFLFNMPGQPLDEARATLDRLRERCAAAYPMM
ncbi:MAG: Uroporphyrinogen decarboxylase (URO-D) [Chloroflexi bacterium ADurb.Bin325]|nr:MAG: Uroporphyrinogen decarboxylase (URO-D) [Chloroflexi bacterium ADurb.Bin325]